MLKYCLFLGLAFCVAAGAAPIDRLRLELPDLLLHARYIGVGRQSPHCHAAGGNHLQ